MGSRELSCVGAMERDCLQQPFTPVYECMACHCDVGSYVQYCWLSNVLEMFSRTGGEWVGDGEGGGGFYRRWEARERDAIVRQRRWLPLLILSAGDGITSK